MHKLRNLISLLVGFSMVFALGAASVRAAMESTFAFMPSGTMHGPWVVTSLFVESGWTIESYKLDHGIIAWSVRDDASAKRRLYVNDGSDTLRLAEMPLEVWDRDRDNGFFDHVFGNYDVADGTVVWTMTDGTSVNDREIYAYANGVTTKVSDNSFDDRHPITDAGRTAWTSHPGTSYVLMVNDAHGSYQLDAYHVPNYAFSGKNLFWLNRLNGEDWFRVFVNDGNLSSAIGQGDDRSLHAYFLVDGKGNVSWEYSTKQWSYDKRRIYVSMDGTRAVEVIQRDVPPHVTYLQDTDGGKIALNVHDHLTSLMRDYSVMAGDASEMRTLSHQYAHTKMRFMDGGVVHHETPENASMVQILPDAGGKEFLTLAPIIHDRFDADGPTVAGALVKGGVAIYEVDGTRTLIASTREARSIDVANGDLAWVEGPVGSGVLKFATHGVTVSSANGPQVVTGSLVKLQGNPTVYLAANDGKRYVFPSEGQFYSWFRDFSGVRTVSSGTLSSMPLSGNVLYAAGSRLVKSPSSSRVYAVGAKGELHWIQSVPVLESYYGTNWMQKLSVVPETVLADYRQGSSVGHYGDYRVIQTSAR